MNRKSILRKGFTYSYGNAALVLVGINILVFFLVNVVPRSGMYLALVPGLVMHGWLWQFMTYFFVHGDLFHLLFNMLGLFFFGVRLERDWGTKEFLLFYLLNGVLVGIASFLGYSLLGAGNTSIIGASGAIFAILLAWAVSYPDSIIYIWGLLPLRAPVLILAYTVIELGSQIFNLGRGVAHLSHLAGFAFAWFYLVVRFGQNPWKRLTGK